MILLSLTVHENIPVILDQIENFKKFAPDSITVIHASRQFMESTQEVRRVLGSIDGVFLNPDPIYTGTGLVLKCHINNFVQADKAGLEFTHFCFHSSNDMFVRKGVEDYVRRHDFGFSRFNLQDRADFRHWEDAFTSDNAYRKMMRSVGNQPTSLVSQVEGTFYPRADFAAFAAAFISHVWREIGWPVNYAHGRHQGLVKFFQRVQQSPKYRKHITRHFYTKEEFYPANFFAARSESSASPYCYMNWDAGLKITEADILRIRGGGIPGGIYDELYSVKRIDRELDDPLRNMIRDLQ